MDIEIIPIFWYTTSKKYISEPIPAAKTIDISTVQVCLIELIPEIKFRCSLPKIS